MTFICEGQEIKEKSLNELYGLSQDQIKHLKQEGCKDGVFEYELAGDIFKIHVLNGEKKETIKDNQIIFPEIKKAKTKRKYFITDIVKDKKILAKNSYKTFITIYGETMDLTEFVDRANLYDTFFRNNNIQDATSYKINGVQVYVKKKPKNTILYNITNKKTGEIFKGYLKAEALDLLKCSDAKLQQATKFNPIITYKDFKIERKRKDENN